MKVDRFLYFTHMKNIGLFHRRRTFCKHNVTFGTVHYRYRFVVLSEMTIFGIVCDFMERITCMQIAKELLIGTTHTSEELQRYKTIPRLLHYCVSLEYI